MVEHKDFLFHDFIMIERNINFLRELKFKGEKKEIDEKYFFEEECTNTLQIIIIL